jgi:hypothetical protein
MIHLNLLVEGKTELQFAKSVLASHLALRQVHAYPITVLTSKDTGLHREFRGGVLSYAQVKANLLRLVKRDQHKANAWFTTMVDLYRLPADFPGCVSARGMQDPFKRVALLEDAWVRDVGCPRFIPYLQLHEYEALLLADPPSLGAFYQEDAEPIRRLAEMAAGYRTPEEIDDGDTTAPSKRIIAEIPAYAQDKAVAGPFVAEKIGLPKLRQKCPHFNEWLDKLEALAS